MKSITLEKVAKAKSELEKLAKHQETVKTWDTAMKGYKAPDGYCVVEIQITDDGRVRHVTDKIEDPTLFKKTG